MRAYRLYLAGSAMAFERGWMSLHQMLAARPERRGSRAARCAGAQSDYPFNRDYMVPMIYKFRSKATGDVIMLGPNGDQVLRLIGREPAAKGIIEPAAMPARDRRRCKPRSQADEAPRADNGKGADDGAGRRATRPCPCARALWPMVDMLQRAHAADEPIVWGV